MPIVFNMLGALFFWLLWFEPHLLKMIAIVPINEIIATLTFADFVLLALCFIGIWFVEKVVNKIASVRWFDAASINTQSQQQAPQPAKVKLTKGRISGFTKKR